MHPLRPCCLIRSSARELLTAPAPISRSALRKWHKRFGPTPRLSSRPMPLLLCAFAPKNEKRTHKAHIMIGILVVLESPRSRQLYAKLRATYSLTRRTETLQIPPLEEWRGVSVFCNRVPCRWVVSFVEPIGLPTPPTNHGLAKLSRRTL